MTNYYSKRMGGQLLVLAAVLFGTMLLLTGLASQEAQGREEKNAAQGQEEQKTVRDGQEKEPAGEKQGGKKKDSKKDSKGKKEREKVLDKDPEGNEVVSGELIVTYKEETPEAAKDEAPEEVGAQVEKDFSKADTFEATEEEVSEPVEEDSEIEVQHISLPEVKDEQDQETREETLEEKKEDLEQDPNVQAVEYNHVVKDDWTPNDTSYKNQWGYPKIKAPQAWDYTRGSGNVRVAVIDGGIDLNHPDLAGKVVAQTDYVDDDAYPWDERGHGTHVAGTIAANTNNGQGVAGTCPDCSLVIARVSDRDGKINRSDRISAIYWASYQGAWVINISNGGSTYSYAEEQAVNHAWNNGAVVVASAGNVGASHHAKNYPAAYPNVIAVANTDINDNRRYTSRSGDWVDVAAPGTSIYSTVPGFWYYDYNRGQWRYAASVYGYKTGTSMAAPHVSGLVGLLASRGHGNQGIRNRIEWTSVDLGMTGKDWDYGHGRIDAWAAVSCQWCRWYD